MGLWLSATDRAGKLVLVFQQQYRIMPASFLKGISTFTFHLFLDLITFHLSFSLSLSLTCLLLLTSHKSIILHLLEVSSFQMCPSVTVFLSSMSFVTSANLVEANWNSPNSSQPDKYFLTSHESNSSKFKNFRKKFPTYWPKKYWIIPNPKNSNTWRYLF